MNNIISGRWLRAVGVLLLLCLDVRPAHAVAITLGSRIDITPTTFALPIQIVDAIAVSEWFLDLTYDPTDVQVNLGCDPFSGDIYCSLLTGPVTEGDFFAAGAPFNLLLPGFVELDPVTSMQTGRLFGLHGAYGGIAPAPSGNGILAYIQFTLLGTGDSPIVGDPTVVDGEDGDGGGVPVPEPGVLALFAIGLAWLGFRRRAAVACSLVASLAVCGEAAAQFGPSIELPPGIPTVTPMPPPTGYPPTLAPTAAGPYYALPARNQTLASNVRFVILSNFNSDAVLDRETGLVWARRNQAGIRVYLAHHACEQLAIGNRKGWRLPTTAELSSLVDTSRPVVAGQPRLPVGHPFLLFSTGSRSAHWVADTAIIFRDTSHTTTTVGRLVAALDDGNLVEYRDVLDYTVADTGPRYGVMCVRAG